MSTVDSPSSGPVFVIGSYRSGTSILAWCLSQHPNLFHLPETYWIAKLSVDLDSTYSLGIRNGRFSHLGQMGLSKDEFYRRMGTGIDAFIKSTRDILINKVERGNQNRSELRRRRSEWDPKTRWVDATPENTHYVPGLLRLFPDAQFIHILRDPHEVARSLENFSQAGGAKDYAQQEAYEAWLRLTRAAVRTERALGAARVHRLAYRDLVENSEVALRKCMAFLGEPYSAECLLPLARKINSSKVEDLESGRSGGGTPPAWVQDADTWYTQILQENSPPSIPVETEMQEMSKDFDDLVAAGRIGERAVAAHSKVMKLYRKLCSTIGVKRPGAVT